MSPFFEKVVIVGLHGKNVVHVCRVRFISVFVYLYAQEMKTME